MKKATFTTKDIKAFARFYANNNKMWVEVLGVHGHIVTWIYEGFTEERKCSLDQFVSAFA